MNMSTVNLINLLSGALVTPSKTHRLFQHPGIAYPDLRRLQTKAFGLVTSKWSSPAENLPTGAQILKLFSGTLQKLGSYNKENPRLGQL